MAFLCASPAHGLTKPDRIKAPRLSLLYEPAAEYLQHGRVLTPVAPVLSEDSRL